MDIKCVLYGDRTKVLSREEEISLFKIRKVKSTSYSGFNKCRIITYEDENMDKFAACTEDAYPKCGDMVEIYKDEHVNYRGFGAMVLKVVDY